MNEKHKLDDFVRGKLQYLQQQPSAAAWDKLQERMAPRKKAFPWWQVSVAASFLLLFSLGLWWWTGSGDGPILVESHQPASSTDLTEQRNQSPEPLTNDLPAVQHNLMAEKAEPKSTREVQIVPVKKAAQPKNELKTTPAESLVEVTIDPLLAAAEVKNPELTSQEIPRPMALKVIYKPGKSDKEIESPEPDVEDLTKEKRGLLKFVALARDIKEGELSIGELRDAKDDLLAINLKGFKNRIQDQIFDREEEEDTP